MTEDAGGGSPLSLWVVPVSDLGGVARHVLDVAREGIPGYRLAVLCPDGPLVQRLRDAGVQVAVGRFGPEAGFFRSIRTLRSAVSRLEPAVVHSHLSYADVIVAATPMPRSVIRVTTEHGIAGDDRVYHGNAAKSRVMAAVHSARLRRFDMAIAVAEATKAAMIAKWSPKQNVHVILNGVDPVEPARRKLEGPLRILALSRLSPEKRLPQLLRAFEVVLARRADARLTVAGVGELESELKELAKQLGISHAVSFPGFLDPESAMSEADVLAQLSVWENCSYSLLDAANRGMRVVASRVGGNPEIVDPRGLVDADDVESVAAALLDEKAVTHLTSWPTISSMTTSISEVYENRFSKFTGLSSPVLPERVTIATNNGDIGGGEVMLLSIARALSELGITVTVVGPSGPPALVAEARKAGFAVVELPASNRSEWIRELRRWASRARGETLWCNGLVPALATAGLRHRIVHFHQRPGLLQRLASIPARIGATITLVPSRSMQKVFCGSTILANWSEKVEIQPADGRRANDKFRVGFLGRPSVDKGVPQLASALHLLEMKSPGEYILQLAGESRFVSQQSQEIVEESLEPIRHLTEFTGWITREEFFASVDLLVVPSVWKEPFGLVVTEAMSARVPVLVSNSGALPEVVGSSYEYVYAARDVAALATSIEAIRNDPHKGFASERMYARWFENYSPASGRNRLEVMLQGAFNHGKTRGRTVTEGFKFIDSYRDHAKRKL